MISIKKKISANVAGILEKINPAAQILPEDIEKMLEYPPDDKMGDLALPCFKVFLRCSSSCRGCKRIF